MSIIRKIDLEFTRKFEQIEIDIRNDKIAEKEQFQEHMDHFQDIYGKLQNNRDDFKKLKLTIDNMNAVRFGAEPARI